MDTIKKEKKEILCSFCQKKSANYTCPRCNVMYCSVACYQHPQHLNCSEEFYHECVASHLKHSQDNDSQRRMVEILKKQNIENNELDSDDDEDYLDLEERLAGVNLDDHKSVWDKLTEEEKSEFHNLLHNDTLNILPEWDPWWRWKEEHALVQVVRESSESARPENLPEILSNIAPLSKLIVKTPSVFLKYSIMNCLYGYVYIVKFYNGEHHKLSIDAIMSLVKISKSLESQGPTWNELESAITSVTQIVQQDDELSNTSTYLVEVIQELIYLIEGSNSKVIIDHALRALSDIKLLIEKAKLLLKKSTDVSHSQTRLNLSLIGKKILFYMAWVQENGAEEFGPLNAELKLIHGFKVKEFSTFQQQKLEVSAAIGKLKLAVNTGVKVEDITVSDLNL